MVEGREAMRLQTNGEKILEEEFQQIISCFDVNGRWFHRDRVFFERSMRRMAETPGGRISLREMRSFVENKRKQDPDFKIEVDFSSSQGEVMGGYNSQEDDRIVVYPNAVNKMLETHFRSLGVLPNSELAQEAREYILATNVIHEFSHMRQNQNDLLLRMAKTTDPMVQKYHYFYAEAEVYALSRSLALEANNPIVRSFFGVSGKEQADYFRKLNQGESPESLFLSNQITAARDFLRPLDKPVSGTYASIGTRFSYMNQSGALARLVDAQVERRMNALSQQEGAKDDRLRAEIRASFIRRYGNAGKDMVSFEEMLPQSLVSYLADQVISEDIPPPKANKSIRYKRALYDLETSLYFLESTSASIHEGNLDYLEISNKHRRVLQEVFHIDLKEKNLKGERIARSDLQQRDSNLSAQLADHSDAVLMASQQADVSLLKADDKQIV